MKGHAENLKEKLNYSLKEANVLRRIAPLTGALILKTLLLINELTCILGNAI